MFNFLALKPGKKDDSNSVSSLEQAEDVQDDPDLHGWTVMINLPQSRNRGKLNCVKCEHAPSTAALTWLSGRCMESNVHDQPR